MLIKTFQKWNNIIALSCLLHFIYFTVSFNLLNQNHILYVKNETEKVKMISIPMEVYNCEALPKGMYIWRPYSWSYM